jgi:hypothetical protein
MAASTRLSMPSVRWLPSTYPLATSSTDLLMAQLLWPVAMMKLKGKELFHESVMENQFLIEIVAKLTPEERQVVHNAFMLLAQTGRQIADAKNRR